MTRRGSFRREEERAVPVVERAALRPAGAVQHARPPPARAAARAPRARVAASADRHGLAVRLCTHSFTHSHLY